MKAPLQQLARELEGELYDDKTTRILYATDASAYRELPLAVALPRTESDLFTLIQFARKHRTSLIPRTAGTSLAGQVVGNGIIVDLSKYFTGILELNVEEKWVRVQPGVIRDELNMYLKPHGLFFGPETSTANRAMIGGMVGNNSCGSNSIVYGSVREHLLGVNALLSDGSRARFGPLGPESFHEKCEGNTLESEIYRRTRSLLGDYRNQEEIRKEFPKKSIERRNTGYALDVLLETAPFTAGGEDFNFCKLIAGSEGTLALVTDITLGLDPLPPKETGLLCVHFHNVDEALRGNLIALRFHPTASELIDHFILECTKDNIEQRKNRFFVQGDPGAILVVEFARENRQDIESVAKQLESALRESGLGYHFPLLFGNDTKKIWTLRKAGLGLLGNLPGDEKAVPVIEDTAVDVQDLPDYIAEFNEILRKYNLYAVHYAHAGSGEIHLRPIINLKTEEGNALFRKIAEEIAALVKKYRGSLSGEHGDGRLRGEFIRQMIGERNYQLLREIKRTWDPENIFNPNKIVDTPPMNSMLRYQPGQQAKALRTHFRFYNQNILQHAEQCNGSGDCRKTELSGGTMCPSYMATRNEKDTTRARANILREMLTHSKKENPFDYEEIYEVMDLCLSCKGCKSECPSNVDMAKLKAEFLQHYYDAHGVPWRTKLIANFSAMSRLGALAPRIYNALTGGRITGRLVRKLSGFAADRSIPSLHAFTLRQWYRKHKAGENPATGIPAKGSVYFFCDEFTNFNDVEAGMKAILLLERLGYSVDIPDHLESARTWLSKGLLKKAKEIIHANIDRLGSMVSAGKPLVGLEPSAILGFRDEYPDLADDQHFEKAKALAQHAFLVDEFIAREIDRGNISREQFTREPKHILLHGHCQQKSISSVSVSEKILSLPEQFTVQTIPSGCCGMAGSFGYEKEHYAISMKIGELVLLPAVRNAGQSDLIAAPGTSCRHQIKDGTGRKALHPAEILYDALR